MSKTREDFPAQSYVKLFFCTISTELYHTVDSFVLYIKIIPGEVMTKIEEFESEIIKSGMKEADFSEYENLLKRVHGNYLKLQHCYITALKFPENNSEQAVKLIRWGLEKYYDTWSSAYRAYYNIGLIYERIGEYEKAYTEFLKAKNVLDEEQTSYIYSLSGKLLWLLLHIDNFQYSEQLEQYYKMFNETNSFEKSFVNNEFCLAVAELVIALHYKKQDRARQAYANVTALINPRYSSKIQDILNKHKIEDTLNISNQCKQFLESVSL